MKERERARRGRAGMRSMVRMRMGREEVESTAGGPSEGTAPGEWKKQSSGIWGAGRDRGRKIGYDMGHGDQGASYRHRTVTGKQCRHGRC